MVRLTAGPCPPDPSAGAALSVVPANRAVVPSSQIPQTWDVALGVTVTNLRGSEVLILLLVVFLLFGAKRLPDAARGIGRSLRIFKAETKGLVDSETVHDDSPVRVTRMQDSSTADATDRTSVAQPASNMQSQSQA
jgi:sec-independent protein translocase protein TatA